MSAALYYPPDVVALAKADYAIWEFVEVSGRTGKNIISLYLV